MSIESNKMTHVEVLRDYQAKIFRNKGKLVVPLDAALTAAIAALDAVGKGQRVQSGTDGWIECTVDRNVLQNYILIPADAVGGG